MNINIDLGGNFFMNLTNIQQGMIYWYGENINFDEVPVHEKCLLKGNRPHIIISGDEINLHSEVCCVIPCTTNLENHAPNTLEVGIADKRGLAMYSQVSTIPQAYLGNYIGKLSNSDLSELNRKISASFNFRVDWSSTGIAQSLAMLEKVINNIADEIIKSKTDTIQDQVCTQITESVAHRLNTMFPNSSTVNSIDTSSIDSSKTVTVNGSSKSARIVWTPEFAKQLLDDLQTNDFECVKQKYNFSRNSQLHSAKSYAKKLLAKNPI